MELSYDGSILYAVPNIESRLQRHCFFYSPSPTLVESLGVSADILSL